MEPSVHYFSSRRLLSIAILSAVAAAFALGQPAWGEEAAPRPAPDKAAEKVSNEAAAAGARNMAEVSTKMAEAVTARYASATGKLKEAADAFGAALKAQAAVQTKASEAAAAGEHEKAASLRKELTDAATFVSLRKDALDAREAEAKLADQSDVENWKRRAGTGAATEFEAFLNARKKTEVAAGKVAELASKPGGDVEAVELAKDELVAARNETLVSQFALNSAAEGAIRGELAGKLNSPDFNRKSEEIKSLDKQYIDAMIKSNDAQLVMRKLERIRRAAALAADQARAAAAPKDQSRR